MPQAIALYRIYELPWSTGAEQEHKFRRIVVSCVAGALVLALILSFLPLPHRDASEAQVVPKRLARLVVERQKPPPPPPPPVVKEPPPPPETVVEQRPKKPEPAPVEKPKPAPVDTVEQARERAKTAGVLKFAQQLASLRSDDVVERLDHTAIANTPAPGASPVNERSLITSKVGSASHGINTAALSRNTGGGGLGSRTVTQVESPVVAVAEAGGAAQRNGESNKASRSREEIERVFDRNKGAIYALYNRALRQNPALQGKVVLRLTIAPSGKVTFCEIVSSELGDAELEQKLVQRVLLFEFEPKDVEPITTTKPIDFFPA